MARIVADRVQETSTTTGNGAYTLSGSTIGFRAASSVCNNGDTFSYHAEDVDLYGRLLGGWETGLGTWGTGGVLTRTTVYASSNANAAVVWASGTRRVSLSLLAEASLGNTTIAGNLSVIGTVDGRDISVDGAILDSMKSMKIDGLLIYYGYPIAYSGIWDVNGVVNAIASKYKYWVVGDTYEAPTQEVYASTAAIISGVRALGVIVYGYVPIGQNTSNRTMPTMKLSVDRWITLNVDGIFLDEFGFDYLNTRERQIDIVNYVHSKNLPICANAWIFEDFVCDNISEIPWPANDWRYSNFQTYNPNNLPLTRFPTDSYLIENFAFDNSAPLNKWDLNERVALIVNRNNTKNVVLWAEAVLGEVVGGTVDYTKTGNLTNIKDITNYVNAIALLYDIKILGIGGFSFGASGTPIPHSTSVLPNTLTTPLTGLVSNYDTGVFYRVFGNTTITHNVSSTTNLSILVSKPNFIDNVPVMDSYSGINTGDQTNIIGNAGSANLLSINDARSTNPNPETYLLGESLNFKANTADGLVDGGNYHSVSTIRQWSDFSGGLVHQLAYTDAQNVWYRAGTSAGTWGTWKQLAFTSSNITGSAGSVTNYMGDTGVILQSYNASAANAPQLTIKHNFGAVDIVNARGAINLVGNASTATALQTARTINGVAFDGSINITVNAVDATARVANSSVGVVNGVASLDAAGKVPATQLPSYVDDVLEYTNLAGFPVTGEAGKIYIAVDTSKTYRWSGTVYVYITSGAVDSVAGKTGVVSLVKGDVGLGLVDNTSDATQNAATATLTNKTLTAPIISGGTVDGAVIGATTPAAGSFTTLSATLAGVSSVPVKLYNSTPGGESNIQFNVTGAAIGQNDRAYITAIASESGSGYGGRLKLGVRNGSNIYMDVAVASESGIAVTGGISVSGALTVAGAITGSNLSGTNTGDQTSITGNAGTATTLQTARTINGVPFNGSVNINTTEWFHSDRGFPNGTLVQTSIDYSAVDGAPWILEIKGNSYGFIVPLDIQYQGYNYANTVIHHGGYSNGATIINLVLFNFNSKLCFWWPYQGYWQGYSVKAYIALATHPVNQVVSISDAVKPVAITKEVALSANIRQSWRTDNLTNLDQLANGPGFATGGGFASGTNTGDQTNITGNAGTATIIQSSDGDRLASTKLPNTSVRSVRFDFVQAAEGNGSGNYAGLMTYAPWTGDTASTGDSSYQLSFANRTGVNASGQPKLSIRNGIDSTWGAWYELVHSGNVGSYAPSLAGVGASGTWGIDISGNAGTVTSSTSRTDSTAYPVVWNITGGSSQNYSCAAVTIQSSTGTLNATTFVGGNMNVVSGDGKGFGFWGGNGSYGMHMSSTGNVTWGGRISGDTTSDYNTYFRMEQGVNRGFVFENAYANKLFAINGDGVRSNVPVTIAGALYATSKSFKINHPTKPDKSLVYGSLEGPEHGVYVRGKLTGDNKIKLPEYWSKLVDPETITVQLTSIGRGQQLYVDKIENNEIIIGNDNIIIKSINCYYFVQAERADIEKLQTEV